MKSMLSAALMLLAAPAFAGEAVTYSANGETFEGYFAKAQGTAKGLVMIVHDWDGLDTYEQTRANMLAEMGYDAFAVDIYGKGNRPATTEARQAETRKLYGDRPLMRARLEAGLAQAQSMASVTPTVVMGYCFGGAATLELARSGDTENVVGWASFHGGTQTPSGQSWMPGTAPVIVLHGGADQAPSMADIAQLSTELEAAGITYDIEVYSGAPHAFTVFGSPRYRERADKKSWAAFSEFLGEVTSATN